MSDPKASDGVQPRNHSTSVDPEHRLAGDAAVAQLAEGLVEIPPAALGADLRFEGAVGNERARNEICGTKLDQ
jgi:hypothetical protein